VVYSCKACGAKDAIFGEGGGAKISELFGEKLLVHIPLDSDIRLKTDAGQYFTGKCSISLSSFICRVGIKSNKPNGSHAKRLFSRISNH